MIDHTPVSPRTGASTVLRGFGKALPWVGLAVLSVVFLVAGTIKALDPQQFLLDIRSYELVADPYAAWLAMGLPWLELMAALGLWWSRTRAGSLLLLGGMLVVFMAAVSSAMSRGLSISCGCFGDIWRGTETGLLVQDSVLLVIAGALLVREWRRAAPVRGQNPAVAPAG